MTASHIKVLQFICSTGYYGGERWITALANNTNSELVSHSLAVTRESVHHELELSRQFSALGLPVHELPMTGRFDLRVISRLKKLIKTGGYQIIHTHGYKSDILGLVAAKLAGITCISTPHGFENTRDLKLRAFIAFGNRTFRYFDCVVPLSEQLRLDVSSMGVKADRLRMIENGVDIKALKSSLPSACPADSADTESIPPLDSAMPAKLGYIGQLVSRKNVKATIDVLNALLKAGVEVNLELIGDGDERPDLEAFVHQLGLEAHVKFLGFVENPISHLQQFDAFVMTSSLEGIPRCLMEAMAMHVPIAAFDIPGVDQLIDHDATGVLAPVGQVDLLAKEVSRLLSDEPLRKAIILRAKQVVETQFSAARMADEYSALYSQLLHEARVP